MDYKGYKLTEEKDRLFIENVRDFDPVHTFECGQCFRWIKQQDGSYTGVAKGRAVRLKYSNCTIEIVNSTIQDFIDIWYEYFDLGRDYSVLKDMLAKDDIMREAVKFGQGIRFLKQDVWEMIISFIISANNMIPRIMRIIAAISKVYGSEIWLEGKEYYIFPELDRLAGSSIEELDFCKGGFRCKYIVQTSQMLKENKICMDSLLYMNTQEARRELMKLPGIGPKVADCVLLFSGIKYDVFPTDVWVKRVMEELYFKREASLNEIQRFAFDYFGDLAGFAQQYLFYYARENKIGVNVKQ